MIVANAHYKRVKKAQHPVFINVNDDIFENAIQHYLLKHLRFVSNTLLSDAKSQMRKIENTTQTKIV